MWSTVIRLIATCATSYWEFLLTTLKSWHRGRGCFVSPAFETTNLLHKCFPRSDSCFTWNLLWFRWNRRVLRRLVFEKLVFESSAFLPLPPSPPGPHQSAHSATDCASNVKCFCAKLWSKATGKALSGNVRPCYTAFAKRVTTLSSTEVCKTWIVHPGLRRSHPIKARHAEAESCKCNRNRQENTRFLAIAQALESSICPLPISCVPL